MGSEELEDRLPPTIGQQDGLFTSPLGVGGVRLEDPSALGEARRGEGEPTARVEDVRVLGEEHLGETAGRGEVGRGRAWRAARIVDRVGRGGARGLADRVACGRAARRAGVRRVHRASGGGLVDARGPLRRVVHDGSIRAAGEDQEQARSRRHAEDAHLRKIPDRPPTTARRVPTLSRGRAPPATSTTSNGADRVDRAAPEVGARPRDPG